jgi:hypothetical protein
VCFVFLQFRKEDRKENNNKMEFSLTNLFEFFEDTSILWASIWTHFVTFTTPYFLPIVHFGIRTYVWIQDLPVFQQKKCKYAEIIASDSWTYTGFLVRTKSEIPFSNEYTMIHHYEQNQDQMNTVACSSADKIESLFLVQNQHICVCHKIPFTFVKPEKSDVHFLYVEFINKENTVSLDIPEEMMQVGNELFTPAFVYRLLDHSSSNFSFLFDLNYRLILVDEHLNSTTLHSEKYLLLEKNTYSVQQI